MTQRRILLIVSGGIAAYKALELVRLLKGKGIAVRAVLTESAAQFVTPLSFGVLTEDHVYGDMFDLKEEREIGHIQLSREADLIVVAPATANILAKMAAGIADDLATTVLLATDKPVLVAPAMNVRMWHHRATQRNLETLRADGIHVMEPGVGAMACNEWGKGRLPEPVEIATEIERLLAEGAAPHPLLTDTSRTIIAPDLSGPTLHGRHVLVTAGPTHEPIDPVRYIANRSSGQQGFAIAAAAARAGARVTLVAGPVSLPTPRGVERIDVETAREMLAAVEAALPADVAIMVAGRCRLARRGRSVAEAQEGRHRRTGAARACRESGHPAQPRRPCGPAGPADRLCRRDGECRRPCPRQARRQGCRLDRGQRRLRGRDGRDAQQRPHRHRRWRRGLAGHAQDRRRRAAHRKDRRCRCRPLISK